MSTVSFRFLRVGFPYVTLWRQRTAPDRMGANQVVAIVGVVAQGQGRQLRWPKAWVTDPYLQIFGFVIVN